MDQSQRKYGKKPLDYARETGKVEYQITSEKKGQGKRVWRGVKRVGKREKGSSPFFHICPHSRYEKPEPRLLFINPNFHKRTVNRTNSQENGYRRERFIPRSNIFIFILIPHYVPSFRQSIVGLTTIPLVHTKQTFVQLSLFRRIDLVVRSLFPKRRAAPRNPVWLRSLLTERGNGPRFPDGK